MAGGTSSQNRKICTPILSYYYGSGFGPRPASRRGISTDHKGVDLESLEIDIELQQQTRIFAPCHALIYKIVDYTQGLKQGEAIYLEVQDDVKQANPDFNALGINNFRFFHLRPGCLESLGLKEGQYVEAGQLIGFMGRTGIAESAEIVHLHLETLTNRASAGAIDPLPFLRLTQAGAKVTKNVKETAGNKQTNPNFGITFLEKVEGANYQQDDDIDPTLQSSTPPNPIPSDYQPYSTSDIDIYKLHWDKIEDEEIALGIIPLFMDKIINFKESEIEFKNFIGLDGGKNTAILPNLVLGKDISNYNVLDFTNIELGNMVPYAELYSVKMINDKKGADQFIDILFPFDDYTEQRKLDSIFYDRTSRGGNIGLKSVEWETLATNMSNQSFIEAKVKIHIQDIKDISTVRNGISLLDFLYPMGTTNPEFKTKSFTVKMKAGWIFKKNQTTNRLDDFDLSDQLTETMYLTLTNHRFEFLEDGSVDLTLDYKGMLESLLLEQDDFDILDSLSSGKKVLERTINFWKKVADLFDDELKGQALINKVIRLINDKNNLGVFEAVLEYNEYQVIGNLPKYYSNPHTNHKFYTPKSKEIIEKYEAFKSSQDNVEDTISTDSSAGIVKIALANQLVLPNLYVYEDINHSGVIFEEDERFDSGVSILYGKDVQRFDSAAVKRKEPLELFSEKNYDIKIRLTTEPNLQYDQSTWKKFLDAVKNTYTNAPQESWFFEVSINKGSGRSKLKRVISKYISELEKQLQASYRRPLANLFNNIDINYISLSQKQIDTLKKINTVSNNLNDYQIEEIKLEIESILNNNIQSFGSVNKQDKINKALEESIESKKFAKTFTENLLVSANGESDLAVGFVYLGQILDYYIELFYGKNPDLKNALNLVLGSFSYTNFGNLEQQKLISGIGTRISQYQSKELPVRSFEKKYANLAELPISIESFLSWYSSHITDANLKKLSFLDFLKSLFNNIINANLKNSIVPFTPTRSIIPSFNFMTIGEPPNFNKSLVDTVEILSQAKGGNRSPGPIVKYRTYKFRKYVNFNNIDSITKNNVFYKIKKYQNKDNIEKRNMLFIFSKNEKDLNLNSDFKSDIAKSIFHLYVGQETGLVKSIKFTRQDNQRLESANILRANNNQSENVMIRQIYNLDLEMFGNTLFTPGQLIHITPTYPGSLVNNPVLYQIGLGGYYMINKISNTIEENEFITKITGQWQMHGGGYERVVNGNGGFIIDNGT